MVVVVPLQLCGQNFLELVMCHLAAGLCCWWTLQNQRIMSRPVQWRLLLVDPVKSWEKMKAIGNGACGVWGAFFSTWNTGTIALPLALLSCGSGLALSSPAVLSLYITDM